MDGSQYFQNIFKVSAQIKDYKEMFKRLMREYRMSDKDLLQFYIKLIKFNVSLLVIKKLCFFTLIFLANINEIEKCMLIASHNELF
ncbi:hypothetical protein BpHYR1_004043 [Brachionus plicatilis]|uniref:Uncharacterized protein n=1 Tax=Brachionus plicatilis TaxID=10195 RepID=A0A3M7RS07_BRAPC|nr:hypothetical protein BpHYR1_004043 [Brachionus plicatilis]